MRGRFNVTVCVGVTAGVLAVLAVAIILFRGGWSTVGTESPPPPPAPDVSASLNLAAAIQEVENITGETAELRKQLIEQGYSAEAADDLINQGVRRAEQLPYIAAVQEIYGTPWNLPLTVDDFTLVDLYVIDEAFVLGIYEREDSEDTLWVRMSTTESYKGLQANLDYVYEKPSEYFAEYLDSEYNTIGFALKVRQSSSELFSRYVATASFAVPLDTVEGFVSSVVDAEVMAYENEQN